jgi:hypothetical protein
MKNIEEANALRLTVVETSEWKHTVLKWVARLLFLRKANYVIVIHDFDPVE